MRPGPWVNREGTIVKHQETEPTSRSRPQDPRVSRRDAGGLPLARRHRVRLARSRLPSSKDSTMKRLLLLCLAATAAAPLAGCELHFGGDDGECIEPPVF